MDLELVVSLLGSVGLGLAAFWVLRKKKSPSPESKTSTSQTSIKTPSSEPSSPPLSAWQQALRMTRARFAKPSTELKSALEEAFLSTDLGVKNTQELLDQLSWSEILSEARTTPFERALSQAKGVLSSWLKDSSVNDVWPSPLSTGPKVLWFVGVNGVGKTTSIAKLAQELVGRGDKVLLAAGDTFRAAAGQQLQTWADRLGIECIRGPENADSSAVLFDAIQAAVARKIDFVLCDSAGRLHNQSQLMEALRKNKRVMEKALPGAPHEVLLVLDANTGQNMLSQARQFLDSVGVTGLILTKLDGSARGGAVIAVRRDLGLPIRRLGLGEKPQDFASFEAKEFLDAMLGTPPV